MAFERKCAESGADFTVDDRDLAFLEKISPTFKGTKYLIPPPSLSPERRLRRRLAYANQIHVYLRPDSYGSANIFSNFPETAAFPVTENETWRSGSVDGTEFGRAIDFNRTFFEQFSDLESASPHPARNAQYLENSDYCNNVSNIKNCYFVFNTSGAEDCFYCENAWDSKDCIDCSHTTNSELCWDCVMCARSYLLQSSEDCEDCSESFYLLNCRNCKNCFGCANLRHKRYCVFNKQMTPSEYAEFVSRVGLETYSGRCKAKQTCVKFWKTQPRPHAILRFVEDVSGNYIAQSRDVQDSFLVRNGENCRYCFNLDEGVKDCCDYLSFGRNAELIYETARSGIDIFNLRFCLQCVDSCSELFYCAFCQNCQHCFACVGLYRKKYCILNRQYSKEDYETLVPKLIRHMEDRGEWGEFFPVPNSPVPYNHSHAQRYFPQSREEVESFGGCWYEYPSQGGAVLEAEELPDIFPDKDDSLTVRSIRSKRVFRITGKELVLLRKLGAPLPRTTYNERMNERAMRLGGVRLYSRRCPESKREMRSTIPPDSDWIVWHRDAYEDYFSA